MFLSELRTDFLFHGVSCALLCLFPEMAADSSRVLRAVLGTLTFLSFGNYVFKTQFQKGSLQNNELFSSQTLLESLQAFCYAVCVGIGEWLAEVAELALSSSCCVEIPPIFSQGCRTAQCAPEEPPGHIYLNQVGERHR